MRTQIYTPTQYSKFTNAEAQAVYDELTGEAKEYIDLMVNTIVTQNAGIKDFGKESAKELVMMAIAKGFFTPAPMIEKLPQ